MNPFVPDITDSFFPQLEDGLYYTPLSHTNTVLFRVFW